MLTFVAPPPAVRDYLEEEYGHLLQPGMGAEVRIRYRTEPSDTPRVTLQVHGVRTAGDVEGRFLLLDGGGRAAQLPATGQERDLWADPELCTLPNDATHQHVLRLLEWRLMQQGMVMLKGAAVSFPEGTVAVCGFEGSGKTSTTVALLGQGEGYLGEERVVLSGPATLAAFPTPIKLLSTRRYQLEPGGPIGFRDRRLMSMARVCSRLPGHAGAVARLAFGRRWVAFDPVRAFPRLSVPQSAVLDSLVFLLPTDGGEVILESMRGEATQVRAALHAAYFDTDMLHLRTMFGYAFPDHSPWPVFTPEVSLRRLRDLVAGVAGWALRYPRGASAAEVAGAARSTLASPKVS